MAHRKIGNNNSAVLRIFGKESIGGLEKTVVTV
jgi:hypothetical protein